ncbi:MAG: hypothetical protein LBS57_00170 [Treponema sp.]|jgi:hypothetical protein|nr:hypothetical protein [Treponema sp.]
MKKEKIIILVFFAAAVCFTAPLFSLSLEDLVGSDRAAILRTGAEPLAKVQLKNPQPVLLPRHAALQRLAAEIQQNLEPAILVETLSLYRKPGSSAAGEGAPADNGAAWTETERAELFNQVLALSTLSGIQYYSASRGVMRTFYESSRVIDGPDKKQPLPDPSYASPPARLTLFARQKDLTFGDNVYQYEYISYSDAFVFIQQNLTPMTAGIIPAVGKNKLRTVVAVIDCGDSLLIYSASMAKTAALPGMSERIGNSFTNRAAAILKWFTGRADAVLGN